MQFEEDTELTSFSYLSFFRMVLFVIDQDSIDELTSYSQNTESEYKRSIIICQKIVYRINGFDNVGCLAKDIKGKLEECNFKYSSITNGLFMREAKRLHKNYMTDMGLRNGYVKNNLSVATLNKLAEELYEIY